MYTINQLTIIGFTGNNAEAHYTQNGTLRTIRVIWPECPAGISADGQTISIDHGVAVVPKDALRL